MHDALPANRRREMDPPGFAMTWRHGDNHGAAWWPDLAPDLPPISSANAVSTTTFSLAYGW